MAAATAPPLLLELGLEACERYPQQALAASIEVCGPRGVADDASRPFSSPAKFERAVQSGLAMHCATHNMELAGRMDRRVTLRNGLVVET